MVKPTFISSLPPPILVKLQKKVNEISKYFKKSVNLPQKKSYTQASSQFNLAKSTSSSRIITDTLKIKKTFSNLPNKKIDMVQKIVNSDKGKLKPKINMTTKDPFHKQVIVLMNNKLVRRLIKDSSMYIINLNYTLKNILSNTIADFIYAKDKEIVITTNNIFLSSNP